MTGPCSATREISKLTFAMQCEQMAKAVGMVLTRTALAFAASASTLLVVLLLFDAYWQYITGHSMSLPLAQSNSRHQQADRAIQLDPQALMCCCYLHTASTTHGSSPDSRVQRRRRQLPHARTNQDSDRDTHKPSLGGSEFLSDPDSQHTALLQFLFFLTPTSANS